MAGESIIYPSVACELGLDGFGPMSISGSRGIIGGGKLNRLCGQTRELPKVGIDWQTSTYKHSSMANLYKYLIRHWLLQYSDFIGRFQTHEKVHSRC